MSRSLDFSNILDSGTWPRGRKLDFSKLLDLSALPCPVQGCQTAIRRRGGERFEGRGQARFPG
jgi:hypothetical protein